MMLGCGIAVPLLLPLYRLFNFFEAVKPYLQGTLHRQKIPIPRLAIPTMRFFPYSTPPF